MKLLLVEDEENLVKHLKKALEVQGYSVEVATNGKDALEFIEIHHDILDLIVLDIMLPGMLGTTICRKVRSENIMTPILMLTAKASKEDIIQVLDYGADDYVTKPFSVDELFARIRALLRRPKTTTLNKITVDELTILPESRRVFHGEKEIFLTVKEFEVLLYLAQNLNKVINRETLLEKIWDINFETFSNVVDAHVKNLRKKLAVEHEKELIESVRGVGYRITA